MSPRPRALMTAMRGAGAVLAVLGTWLVVAASSAVTDLAQVAGVLGGAWMACTGLGLLLLRDPLRDRTGRAGRRRPAARLVLVAPPCDQPAPVVGADLRDPLLDVAAS